VLRINRGTVPQDASFCLVGQLMPAWCDTGAIHWELSALVNPQAAGFLVGFAGIKACSRKEGGISEAPLRKVVFLC